jgi:hypothetical protein
LLQKEQDKKAEEEKKQKEREDQEKKDKVQVDAEEELARSAKELEDEMEVELDWTGDTDTTPRAQHNLFGDLEGGEDTDEEVDPELDKTSEDPKEKECVVAHKETKSAEVHLATARGNLTTAVYTHGYTPSEAADQLLVQWWEELQGAVARLRTAWARDAMLMTSVISRWKRVAEKAVVEQQDKEEGWEKLMGAARRKGAEKTPPLAEPWGKPGMECNTCRNAKATCTWPSGTTKRIRLCDCCRGQKAGCKIGGALDPQSRVLKPKPVQQGEGASEDHPAKWRRTEVEGSRVGSSGATTGVRSGGVATGVRGGGNTTRAGATREPLASTTVGQLIWLVAAQSEHMARLDAQVAWVADGLERQLEQIEDQVEWIGNQVGRVAGVMERAEGWTVARGGGRPPGMERPRNGSERRGADKLSGPLIVME